MATPAESSPPPGRRERKRLETLDHLADTAWALFEAQGYEPVTMEAIAEAADVAKGTLYKHFPEKGALLRHRFHRELARALPDILVQLGRIQGVGNRLRAFFHASATWSETHRPYLPEYLGFRLREVASGRYPSPDAPCQRSGFDRLFTDFVATGQAQGEFRRDIAPEEVAHHLEFLYLGALLRWLHGGEGSLAEAYDRMLDLFLHGVTGQA